MTTGSHEPERRNELAAGQEPFAIILGCSDSRAPAEIVFDQGLGDLFVIRVAGNIVASSQAFTVWGLFWPPWKNFNGRRETSRGICVRSLIVFGHPWKPCRRQSSGTTRML